MKNLILFRKKQNKSESKLIGFTLIELLIALLLGIILITASIIFFTNAYREFYKKFKLLRQEMKALNVMEVIAQDIKKAGYGLNETAPPAAECSGNTLILRFVDFTKSECANHTWEENDPSNCSYIIKYGLNSNNQICRGVSQNASTSNPYCYAFFNENNTVYEKFSCKLFKNEFCGIAYNILIKSSFVNKIFNYTNFVLMPNWRYCY